MSAWVLCLMALIASQKALCIPSLSPLVLIDSTALFKVCKLMTSQERKWMLPQKNYSMRDKMPFHSLINKSDSLEDFSVSYIHRCLLLSHSVTVLM